MSSASRRSRGISRRRLVGRVVGTAKTTGLTVGLGAGLVGCLAGCSATGDGGDGGDGAGEAAPVAVTTAPTLPTTTAELIAALRPMPAPALSLRYAIEGPGGLRGTLEIRVREGGYRRQDWSLRAATMDGQEAAPLVGTTIETPDWSWSRRGAAEATFHPRAFGALARAYLSRNPADRRAVMRTIGDWHAGLREARAAQPGEREELEGVSCLRTRVAAQTLCLWEETGLPLRHEGAGFSLRVTSIDRSAPLSAQDFALPQDARAMAIDAGEEARIRQEAERLIGELIRGNYAPIARISDLELTPPEAG